MSAVLAGAGAVVGADEPARWATMVDSPTDGSACRSTCASAAENPPAGRLVPATAPVDGDSGGAAVTSVTVGTGSSSLPVSASRAGAEAPRRSPSEEPLSLRAPRPMGTA